MQLGRDSLTYYRSSRNSKNAPKPLYKTTDRSEAEHLTASHRISRNTGRFRNKKTLNEYIENKVRENDIDYRKNKKQKLSFTLAGKSISKKSFISQSKNLDLEISSNESEKKDMEYFLGLKEAYLGNLHSKRNASSLASYDSAKPKNARCCKSHSRKFQVIQNQILKKNRIRRNFSKMNKPRASEIYEKIKNNAVKLYKDETTHERNRNRILSPTVPIQRDYLSSNQASVRVLDPIIEPTYTLSKLESHEESILIDNNSRESALQSSFHSKTKSTSKELQRKYKNINSKYTDIKQKYKKSWTDNLNPTNTNQLKLITLKNLVKISKNQHSQNPSTAQPNLQKSPSLNPSKIPTEIPPSSPRLSQLPELNLMIPPKKSKSVQKRTNPSNSKISVNTTLQCSTCSGTQNQIPSCATNGRLTLTNN
ncbi:unnamed protein product [Moneuplotes crassus]|uniref:Uncharacterized protein n=1 Tax=Euplotes crassus TaxID=5936 RepID=A0AAD1U9S8_EUPCR|nr:unnamed protein product [Moneuplotes crassus]